MMTSQRKKPLPDQHPKAGPPARKVEAARKVEPAEPPQPQLEVLQERMNQMATREEMQKLRGEFMERIGKVEICMGEVKSELRLIRWLGGALGVAIIAGLVRIIFFPVV